MTKNTMRWCYYAAFVICLVSVDTRLIKIHDNSREWIRLHNEVRAEQSLYPLEWSLNLAKKAIHSVNKCAWSEAEVNRRNSLQYMHLYWKEGSPSSAMTEVLNERGFAKNGNVSTCCIKKTKDCCAYAKVLTTSGRHLGCYDQICSQFNFKRTVYPDAFFAVCYYDIKD